jgi:hypothetical protein
MSRDRRPHLILVACVLGLVGLGLMVWSLFDPRPVPVIVAMSVGQAAGTLSFLAFLAVAASDIRRALRDSDAPVPPPRRERT